jgi:hypothetical protein
MEAVVVMCLAALVWFGRWIHLRLRVTEVRVDELRRDLDSLSERQTVKFPEFGRRLQRPDV